VIPGRSPLAMALYVDILIQDRGMIGNTTYFCDVNKDLGHTFLFQKTQLCHKKALNSKTGLILFQDLTCSPISHKYGLFIFY
jgi:hypothetical protein